MTVSMQEVQNLWNELKLATGEALRSIHAQPTDTKRVALFQSIPMVFPISGKLPQVKQVTWVNPAGDAYFTEVGHETILETTIGGVTTTHKLVDTEIGLLGTDVIASVSNLFPAIFDFEWNFKYGRDGAQYGVESSLGGTDGYLSRKAFGAKNRGNMLGWSPEDPLVVLAGDSVTWTILPTLLNYVPTNFTSITVNLFMSGFRTGTPAEADYDLR